jgi:hypothetical protein
MYGASPYGTTTYGAQGKTPTLVALTDGYKANDFANKSFYFGVTDGLWCNSLLTVSGYISLADAITAHDIAISQGTLRNSVIDGIHLADLAGVVYRLASVDSFKASDNVTPIRSQIIVLIDVLLATGLVTSLSQAVYVLASAFAANDVALKVQREALTDSVKINDILQQTIRGYHAMVDAIAATDVAVMHARFTFMLNDSSLFTDNATSKGILKQALRDGVDFVAALDINDGHYLAWVLNTDTRAAWRYSNFGFNSFAQFGDSYLGAMDDGVYVLEGTKDAGADIAMMLRTGVFTFGSASMKMLPEVYMAATRSGDIVLKVIITGEDGIKEDHWYKFDGGPAPSLRQDRVQPDGGLETVTLQFEIINLKGSTIDFDSLHLLPVNLRRRI